MPMFRFPSFLESFLKALLITEKILLHVGENANTYGEEGNDSHTRTTLKRDCNHLTKTDFGGNSSRQQTHSTNYMKSFVISIFFKRILQIGPYQRKFQTKSDKRRKNLNGKIFNLLEHAKGPFQIPIDCNSVGLL